MFARIVHKLVKGLPPRVRRIILPRVFATFVFPLVSKHRDFIQGPATVVGFLSSTVGLGQGARLALWAFCKLGYKTRYLDVGKIFYWHKNINIELGEEAISGEGGLLLVHLNPPEMAMIVPLLGRGVIRNKKIVGVWAWELSVLPKSWMTGLSLVDEIWVPSKFVASAISDSTNISVRVVHHPLVIPLVSKIDRRCFDLPRSTFIVLCMFDMRSSAERKNPIGMIRAFRAAFGERADVLLLIKVGNPQEAPPVMARIKHEIGSSENIRLIFDRYPLNEHVNFMACCDVLLSLHRSEGFGLVMAEAMLLGKPVIATGYSGNMDFMDADCAAIVGYDLVPVSDPQGIYGGEGVMWAEPNLDEASEWLKRFESDPALRAGIGDKGKRRAESVFSIGSFKESIGECADLLECVSNVACAE